MGIKMKTYITLRMMFALFIAMSIAFIALGLYSLDSVLIFIACLFVVASLILKLEMQEHLFDPFSS